MSRPDIKVERRSARELGKHDISLSEKSEEKGRQKFTILSELDGQESSCSWTKTKRKELGKD